MQNSQSLFLNFIQIWALPLMILTSIGTVKLCSVPWFHLLSQLALSLSRSDLEARSAVSLGAMPFNHRSIVGSHSVAMENMKGQKGPWLARKKPIQKGRG